MDLVELFLPIVKDVLIIVVLALAGLGIKLYRNWMIETWVKELIVDAVMFVQEKYWQLDGEERFEKAKEWLLVELKKRKIDVSKEWLDALIDRMVKELRAEFGEGWYRDDS